MSKRLYREKETAVLAGVVSGLAKYFEQDPVLFRLATIIMLIITGVFPVVFIYLAAWILMPFRNKQADYTID